MWRNKIIFYGNRINIPGLTFENITQVNYLTDIPLVGTKLGFNDLSVRFYIDEGLENYVEIQKLSKRDWVSRKSKRFTSGERVMVVGVTSPNQR